MIYPLAGALIGAVFGAMSARKREGNRADMAQWGFVGLMIGGIVGLFALIVIERSFY